MFRPGPVTYCRPVPPCVVTDIPKRDNGQGWQSVVIHRQSSVNKLPSAEGVFLPVFSYTAKFELHNI